MKKLLFTILGIALFLTGIGQDTKPTATTFKQLQSPQFWFNSADTSVWMYRGNVYGWTQLQRTSKKYSIWNHTGITNTGWADGKVLGFNASGNVVPLAASAGGATNLTYTASATDGKVNSDTGTDATIPAGSTTNASLMLPADKTKLDGVASQADRYLRWYLRTSHGYTGIFSSDYLDFVAGSGVTIADNLTAGSRTITFSSTGSMTYPGAGIPLSTGSAWGTSITNNSANWNTAYGWGNHAGLYTPLAHKTTEDALNGLVKVNGAGGYTAVTDNSTNWNSAYTNMGKPAIDGGTGYYNLSSGYFIESGSFIVPFYRTTVSAGEPLAPTGGAVYTALTAKQDVLVSATNIKTINGNSLLGSGDLTISGSGISYWDYYYGLIFPNAATDKVLIGGAADVGAYNFQVAGNTYVIASDNGYSAGVFTHSGSTGSGLQVSTVGGVVILNIQNPSANNTATVINTFRRTTSNASNGANNIGLAHSFELESSGGGTGTTGYKKHQLTDATAGSEDANFTWWLMAGGASPTEVMTLSSLGDLTLDREITSTGGKIGYSTGAGGTVTQLTSKATGVTLNTLSGQITTFSAALAAAAEATFTVTNSKVAATDVIIVNHSSGGTNGAYLVSVSAVSAGSFSITYSNVSTASKTEAPVFSFVVIKGV